jgi:hypothetical protein
MSFGDKTGTTDQPSETTPSSNRPPRPILKRK